MAPLARTANHPSTGAPGGAWSIERQGLDVPDEPRFVAGGLILVVVGNGTEPWHHRTLGAALDLAASIRARVLFYDRSAESRFVDPYASGPWTSENPWSRGERMLDPDELRYLGRDYLAEDVVEAAARGVPAGAWLPHGAGPGAMAEAIERFRCDLVVVPAEWRRMTAQAASRLGIRRRPAVRVPVLVSGADRSLHAWQLATELSRIEFQARQFGVLPVRGRFSEFEVRLEFDEAAPEATRIEAQIVAASLTTGLGMRDRDLRSRSFFDVERNPLITFASTRVVGQGPEYTIEGDLTIRDRTRRVELRGRFEGVGIAQGHRRATMRATAQVDRRDWDLNGGFLVGNRIDLEINAVAVRASAEPRQ